MPVLVPARRRSAVAVRAILAGLVLSAPAMPAWAEEGGEPAATELDAVLVVAQRASRASSGATNLDLEIRETPQAISVVSAEQMRTFGADSVNEALRLATGVQVDEWETNRTSYSSRGFDILNTQVDGVGMPNSWGISTGAFDTAGYEKVEVIRGANGLLTGVGNAAGTINYVRKRPTNEREGSLGISRGSWNTLRAEADYSTPFTADGRWAGRVVAAHEQGDSWLRANSNERDFAYGVVDGQVGEDGTLAVGWSYQRAKSDGIMWGALLFGNNDGTQAQWPTSATTTQDWTYWNTTNHMAFVEYSHRLGEAWQLKAAYNYRYSSGDDRMFYAYEGADGLDPDTGLGLYGYPWGGADESTAHLGSLVLDGRFQWLGREHELVLGTSSGRSATDGWEYAADPASPGWGPMPAFPYPTDAIPEPAWGGRELYSVLDQRLQRVFGATRIAVSERFKAILGANFASYRRSGSLYGAPFDQTTRHTSPYAGLTYDFSDQVMGYVSYSDLYQPQDQVDEDDRYLDPSKGVNYEAGVKAGWLDGRLLTTIAVFRADQQGLATPVGFNELGSYIYAGVDVESRGIELEATGRITDWLELVAGYTALELDGLDGADTYAWVPRRSANLLLSGRLPGHEAFSWGVGGRWQSRIANGAVSQDDYAVINAYAAWDFLPNASVRINAGNLGDQKYINTLRYGAGYYGAPRNYTLSMDWRF